MTARWRKGAFSKTAAIAAFLNVSAGLCQLTVRTQYYNYGNFQISNKHEKLKQELFAFSVGYNNETNKDLVKLKLHVKVIILLLIKDRQFC